MACCWPIPSADLSGLPSGNLKRDEGDPDNLSLVVNKDWFWPVGAWLHVRFMNKDPDPRHEEMVKKAAKIWETYANIRFVFDNAEDAEIRILFDSGLKGGRSLIGRYRQHETPKDEATMVLGLVEDDGLFRRTALHELGHALGCVHEHASPVKKIEWNRAEVISWYAADQLPEAWVENNIFKRYDKENPSILSSNFDQRSIMIYRICPGWARNIDYIDWPDELSETDKMLIRRIYQPVMPTTEAVIFDLQDQGSGMVRGPDNVMTVQLQSPQGKAPEIAVGITQFHLECKNGVRHVQLSAYTDNIKATRFDLNLDTIEGAIQYSAGAICLASDGHDPALHTGSYKTRPEDTRDGVEYEAHIEFKGQFKKPPGVVVWLKGFHFEPDQGFTLHATADHIDEAGFQLHIETWNSASLKSAEVSWIAYEKDPPGIRSDKLEFHNFQERKGDRKRHRVKELRLGQWRPGVLPLYAAISKFEFENGYNPRLSIETSHSAMGSFEVDAQTWGDSKCNTVEVSYLAICF
ncbi:hypothetical protein CCMA1212_006906 [Trichoderma ghanense]|uniref:Peptidase metallopeptidase domain-containing protein n=1 Tax=Trichoderma ghanense TaxID=65468 RepID=A0ABY2H1G7_9HYPO